MTPQELRAHAAREVDELGPLPSHPRDRAMWEAERYGAAVLLAGLADYDPQRLRDAAASEWVSVGARDLLLAATDLCR